MKKRLATQNSNAIVNSRPEFLDQYEAANQLRLAVPELIDLAVGARANLPYLRLGAKLWFRAEDVDTVARKRGGYL